MDTAFSGVNLLSPIYIGASTISTNIGTTPFLAVNIDNDSSMRRDMVASFRYQSAPLLTFALGDLEMRKAFGSTEIPYTCIIDQNGQIRYERKGLGADFSVAMAHQLQWVIGMNEAQ